MNPAEIHTLLAYASAIDPRVRRNDPDERVLQAAGWQAQLARYEFVQARAAVDRHYSGDHASAVMPGDIRAGIRAEGSPAYRTVREALESAERGPGDRLARSTPAGTPALQSALNGIAGKWDGQVRQQRPKVPVRSVQETIKRLGGETDKDRALAGKAITVCHKCAVDIPAPKNWDPSSTESRPVYCRTCQPSEASA